MTFQVTAILGGYAIVLNGDPGTEIVNGQTVAAALPGATLDGDDYLGDVEGKPTVAELGPGNDRANVEAILRSRYDMGSGNDIINLIVHDPPGSRIVVLLGEGNDLATIRTVRDGVGSPVHIPDVLYGGAGDDKITGALDDSDVMYGGDGRDTLMLGGTLGKHRSDASTAGEFDLFPNRAYGDGGDDLIIGQNGYDIVRGGLGNDIIKGGGNHVRPPPKSLLEDLAPHPGDYLRGDAGNDTVYGEAGNDRIYGGSGADTLYGGVGNDMVLGGAGRDKLVGGTGHDSLYGGTGGDVFVFNASARAANNDLIRDFSHVDDTIHLDNAFLKDVGLNGGLAPDAFHLGKIAADAEDRIVYDRTTGALYYDRDGLGGAAQVKIATLTNRALLTPNDLAVI